MTTASRTIWELCQETFGRIPAQWRAKIEALDMAYTPGQLEEAFAIARHHRAKSIEYVIEVAGGLRDKAAATATGSPDRDMRLRCDRCPLTEYVNRMTVVAGDALCQKCAEGVRERGALNDTAEHERATVGRERLRELRDEEPCRIVALTRSNRSSAEDDWDKKYFALERDVRHLVRRKSPYMPLSGVEAEIKRLVAGRKDELGPYPEHPNPLWAVLLRADHAASAGAARPLSAAARYVADYWQRVTGQIGATA